MNLFILIMLSMSIMFVSPQEQEYKFSKDKDVITKWKCYSRKQENCDDWLKTDVIIRRQQKWIEPWKQDVRFFEPLCFDKSNYDKNLIKACPVRF